MQIYVTLISSSSRPTQRKKDDAFPFFTQPMKEEKEEDEAQRNGG